MVGKVLEPMPKEKIDIFLNVYQETGSIRVASEAADIHRHSGTNILKRNGIQTPAALRYKKSLNLPRVVAYFTDAHDRIEWDKSRFTWLGKFCKAKKIDTLICGGDVFDVDSLNSHVKNETNEGKLKPAFEKELASLGEALAAIDEHLPRHVVKHITLGNHEQRIWRYENNNPEVCGMLSSAFLCLLERHKYAVTKFKEYLDIDGVEFTHVPINAMGREMGGKTAAMRIATDSMADIVYGHTHNRHDASAPKLGPNNRHTRAYNGGCFMPNGARMDYAKSSQNHWEYGLTVISIFNGKIEATQWVSMAQLERDYG